MDPLRRSLERQPHTETQSFCSISSAPINRITESSLGKIPTTSERLAISLLTRSMLKVQAKLRPVRLGEAVEGEQIVFGAFEELSHFWNRRRKTFDHRSGPLTRVFEVLGVEDLPEGGADHVALALLAVAMHVADEVDGAALPGAADHFGDRSLQSGMIIRDRKLDFLKAAGSQVPEEGCPAGFGQ
jgi:hypothetical protein